MTTYGQRRITRYKVEKLAELLIRAIGGNKILQGGNGEKETVEIFGQVHDSGRQLLSGETQQSIDDVGGYKGEGMQSCRGTRKWVQTEIE